MTNIEQLAMDADVIINGYAITACEEGVRVDNLNTGTSAAVFTNDGMLIETNMDDIEMEIAKSYISEARKYMEAECA